MSLATAADDTYSRSGGESGLYDGDTAIFTNTLTTETYYVSPATNAAFMPLVEDLDGDGIKEIVTLEGGSVVLRNGIDMAASNFVDSIPYPQDTTWNFEKMLIYDLDGDGYKEVHLLLPTSEVIQILEYNGTEFYEEAEHNFSAYHYDADCIFNCIAEGCGIICGKNQAVSNTWTYYGIGYDISGIYPTTVIDHTYKELGYTCLPAEPLLSSGDLNGDGTNELVFSFMQMDVVDLPNADLEVFVVSVQINGSGHLKLSDYVNFDTGADGLSLDDCYNMNFNNTRTITAPVVTNLDGNPNTEEIVVGYDVGDDSGESSSYNLGMFDYNLDLIRDFGGGILNYARGDIVSNVIVGDFFSDTGSGDFCILAIADPDNNDLELMCASPYTSEPPLGYEYAFFEIEAAWDFSVGGYATYPLDYQHIIHTIEVDNTNEGNEILTTWGTYELDFSACTLLSRCNLRELWVNDRQGMTVIPVDYQGNGLSDIIGLSDKGIFYIDDNYNNRPPQFATDVSIDPCPPTIKNGSTIKINFGVTDTEGDPIEAWFTLWDGASYLYNSSRQTVESGEYVDFVPYNDYLNFTTTNGRLTLYIQDDDEDNSPVNQSYTIVVNPYGNEYGTGYSCNEAVETPVISGSGDTCTSNEDCTGNLVCRANICQQYTEEEIIDAVLPPDTVPEVLRPLIGLAFIIAVIWVVFAGLNEFGFTDSRAAIYIGGLAAIAAWMITVIFGLIPAWSVLVAVLIASAFIGNKVLNREP